MSKFLKSHILPLLLLFSFAVPSAAFANEVKEEEEKLDVKEIIFEHLGDGYGWEVPFVHQYRIPLPVIVRAEDGSWHCFSSARLTELHGEHPVPVPVEIKDGDKSYTFMLATEGSHKNKIVQLLPLTSEENTKVALEADSLSKAEKIAMANVNVEGYINCDGKFYAEYKPFDISITKNVLALFISAIVVTLMLMCIVRWYKKNPLKAPRKGNGFLELIVEFVYDGVIKNTLGKNAPKFAPYLMTAFFFILVMNLLGLIVIFPGGANLTGNIAITLVMAVMTLIMTNVKAKKHYWKEIFWPDVPIWLKCPLPIMQFIEIFGIFTKPAALCVRLFANMMGGHMIVITLILLIFVFGAFGMAAVSGVTVVSIAFTIFMLALDVLVSFIQAYVFTMLSTLFIALAQEDGHEEGHSKSEPASVEA
ncbi:MAG: F0F1 ATP synthase subunit A [Prevotella sp.]|nr:F0F1 ATP synthase subunit A [Prevotella sp.]MCM1074923.1 F0F1 ATP synthase subunit A [Ruminococcus sp.]